MRVAFYECDITPPLGEYIWGYYSKRIADDVADNLYAKAIVCEEDGKYVAIVCVDTCAIPKKMHEIVTKRIEEYTGIGPESVCICSNHTHKGAPIFDSPELRLYADEAYLDVFYRRTADAVILAFKRLEEAEVSFGRSEVHGIAFNRNGEFDDGNYYTHIRSEHLVRIFGEIDPSLSVIKFERNGKPIGAIINYALHQDCTNSDFGYSGDYSSIIAKELKKEYGEDFVSLFVLGTCGDINHVNNDVSVDISKQHDMHVKIGKKIANEVKGVFKRTEDIGSGIAVVKEKISISKRTNDIESKDAILEKLQNMLDAKQGVTRINNFLHYALSNETQKEELYVQTLKLGRVLVYALPGELYVKYGLDIKKKSPADMNIVIELCNNYCGYIPTKEAFAPNSRLYEISPCYHSCLVPEAGEIIVDTALKQAEMLNC